MAKKKFDTNPLDPTFPERVREAETAALPKNDYETREFPPPSVTEEQTRRFGNQEFNDFNSPFNGQNIPANFKPAQFANVGDANSRKVSKVGLPENILTALAYIPWFIGMIAGILILLFVPKSETKARFHAAQGLAAHIGILLVTMILGFADNFVPLADTANVIFQVVTMVMLVIFAIKAFQGKPIHIESVDALTEWLEEKIKPQK